MGYIDTLKSNHRHPNTVRANIASGALPYFPAPLPDETFRSLIHRYQLLSGHPSMEIACKRLFGYFSIRPRSALCPSLHALAQRLPGDPERALEMLVRRCAFAPLFQTFYVNRPINAGAKVSPLHGLEQLTGRRARGDASWSHMCDQCIIEDADAYGIAYEHRAHQIPGVRSCWKHRLMTDAKVFRHITGFDVRADNSITSKQHPTFAETEYAIFAKRLLDRVEMAANKNQLADICRERIKELGLCNKANKINQRRLVRAIVAYHAAKNPRDVVYADYTERLVNPLTQSVFSTRSNHPIRYLLMVTHFLFRDADIFLDALKGGQCSEMAEAIVSDPKDTHAMFH